jgi:hypothetical protein
METKTIVIGGGMAGLSCALKLQEANEDFLLITDDLGGRIKYSPETGVNYGAYFIMKSYRNAGKLITQGKRINPLDVCFHNSKTEQFSLLHFHSLKRLRQLIRFYFAMREFSGHYEKFKQRCLTLSQKEAMELDPYMKVLYGKPANDFIREKGYSKVADDYISKFTYACTGVGPEQLNALDFLNVSMGILLPIYHIQFDAKKIADRFGDQLKLDTITKIEKEEGKFRITGKSGTKYKSGNIVVATPADATQDLLKIEHIRGACKLYVFHVEVKLKTNYTRFTLNLFPLSSEVMLTAKQGDGTYLIYSRKKKADLHQVCENYKLITMVPWEKAMYVFGNDYLEQEFDEGLYIAGDHNGLGLEPASISGIYAANRIISKSVKKFI